MDNVCEKIADLIAKAKHTVVLTGAGISTLSGIADFRSDTDGIFQKQFRGMNLELVHDLAHFMKHPEDFYDYARTFHYRFHEKKPNIVHTTLARWQQQGVIGTIYTQNIDMLHQLGGAKDVVEFHGTMAMHHCLKCHKSYTYEDMLDMLKSPEVPRCPCGGLIKPDVVFFGEGLDMDLFDKAIADMRRADLMLVLGIWHGKPIINTKLIKSISKLFRRILRKFYRNVWNSECWTPRLPKVPVSLSKRCFLH